MKKISNVLKKDWVMLILIILGFALGLYFYPLLPDRVPTHWNFKGQVDGYGGKFLGAFGLAFTNLGMYLLFIVLPFIDPKGKSYEGFQSTYQYLKYLLIIFFLGIEVATLLIGTGVAINITLIIQIMISLLFIFLGNVMGRFKYTCFVGIRTPWTLANEAVWRKTHRMAAPIWVIGGILNIILTVTEVNFNMIGSIIVLVTISILPIVYSYIIYHQIVNEKCN